MGSVACCGCRVVLGAVGVTKYTHEGREAKRPTATFNPIGCTWSPSWEDEYAGCHEGGFELFKTEQEARAFAEQNPCYR